MYASMSVCYAEISSGFCIHLSHQRSRDKDFTVFFVRRFFRIYPPYVLALVLVIGCILFTNIFFGVSSVHGTTRSEIFQQAVPHLFLIHNLSARYFSGINSALWSVAVEFQLYLLYPLLLFLATKWSWLRVLWITASVEIGLRSIEALSNIPYPGWVLPRFCTGSPFYYWFSWTMGAALADAYLKKEPLPFRNRFVFVWPLLFIGCSFFQPFSFYGFTLAALSTTALMAFGLSLPRLDIGKQGWGSFPIEHIRQAGIVSYSAYLLHVPLLSQVPRFIHFVFHHQTLSPLIVFVFCLFIWIPVFALSSLFYKYVELPSIAWGKAIISRR